MYLTSSQFGATPEKGITCKPFLFITLSTTPVSVKRTLSVLAAPPHILQSHGKHSPHCHTCSQKLLEQAELPLNTGQLPALVLDERDSHSKGREFLVFTGQSPPPPHTPIQVRCLSVGYPSRRSSLLGDTTPPPPLAS